MQVYLVGGAVRDKLLGIKTSDKDFVVVGSNQQEMLELGFKQVGKDFPVFLHPKTFEEYALARIEKKIGLGYKGFETKTQNVSLKQDLSRRDLTINSMAIDKNGKLIDYFGGENDLQARILRHTSTSFNEDPVRVLRIARFAAKFKKFDFTIAQPTFKLLQSMVQSGEVDNLVKERIFTEIIKTLKYETPSMFFNTLASCGAYTILFNLPPYKLKNHTTPYNNFEFLDNLLIKNEIKFALWLHTYTEEEIKNICITLGAPKTYKDIAILGKIWAKFADNFNKQTTDEKIHFFKKTDSIRRINRFNDLLNLWQLLGIETKIIKNINIKIKNIDTSKMNKSTITKEMTQAKIKICNIL